MKVVDLNFSGDKIIVEAIPGSSNGRTGDSGSSNRGSNPCPGAIYLKNRPCGLFFVAPEKSDSTIGQILVLF